MGGTARRDKTLAVPCRCFEIWPGSAASPVSGATKRPYQRARKRQRHPVFNL